jgi:hypothetical protein
MTVYDYLKKEKEPIPRWLLEIKAGDPFPYQDFYTKIRNQDHFIYQVK